MHIVNKPPGILGWGTAQDGIVLYIDADHSGGKYSLFNGAGYTAEDSYRYENSQAQSPEFSYPNLDGINQCVTTMATWYYEPGSPFMESAFTYNGISNGAGTTTYEIRMGPLFDDLYWLGLDNSKTHTLKQNDMFGFGIELFDYDTPTYWDDLVWSKMIFPKHKDWNLNGQMKAIADASYFSDFLLSPPEVSVNNTSWGRIKASFR